MYKLTVLFSLMVTLSTTAIANENSDLDHYYPLCENLTLEDCFMETIFDYNEPSEKSLNINPDEVEVIEIEEEVSLGFNPKDYLPEGFNPLKGKHDLDWSKIELVEVEEFVEFNFDAKAYLPVGFNPLKGKHDLDWSKIELVEIEEDVELSFDPKNHLPEGFNACKGMCKYTSKLVAFNK